MRRVARGEQQAVTAAETETGGADLRQRQFARHEIEPPRHLTQRCGVGQRRKPRRALLAGFGRRLIRETAPRSRSRGRLRPAHAHRPWLYWSMPCTDGSSRTPACASRGPRQIADALAARDGLGPDRSCGCNHSGGGGRLVELARAGNAHGYDRLKRRSARTASDVRRADGAGAGAGAGAAGARAALRGSAPRSRGDRRRISSAPGCCGCASRRATAATRWAGTCCATSPTCSRPPTARRPGCSTSIADHTVLVATFPAQAQDEVWGKNHNTITSASFDPAGRATRVDGGFLYSGRHGFSSGIDYASWLICGGLIAEKDGLDGPHFFLVPKSDVEVIDDWETMALEGTGSKSFVVTDKFIPAHRFLDGRLSRSGTGPGTAVNKAAVYRAPRFGGTAAAGFSALAVGMARGVLAEWLALTGPRTSRGVAVGAQQGDADPCRPLRGRDRRRACALPVDGARRHAQARGGRHREQRRAADRPAQHRVRLPACAQGRHAAVQCRRRPRALPEGRDAAAIPQPARRGGASRRDLGAVGRRTTAPRCSSSTARRGRVRRV